MASLAEAGAASAPDGAGGGGGELPVLSNVRRTSFSVPKIHRVDAASPRSDLFIMKVMRLASPFLSVSHAVPFSVPPVTASSPLPTAAQGGSSDGFCLGSDLTISASLGTIYQGETFRTCVSITHRSPHAIQRVSFKIQVQTARQKTTLFDTSNAPTQFGPDESRDFVLDYKISDLGETSLVCAVHYEDEEGQKLTFQKFFVFKVEAPFDYRFGLHQREDNLMFAQLDLKNLIPEPVYVEHVRLQTNPLFVEQSLNTVRLLSPAADGARDAIVKEVPTCGERTCMGPGEERSYIFRVSDRDPADKGSFSVGCFVVEWRSSMGKHGSLTTKTLCRPSVASPMSGAASLLSAASSRDLSLRVIEAPSEAVLERPFTIALEVTNTTPRTLTVTLEMNRRKMLSVLPFGLSTRCLGQFAPHSKQTVAVQLLPLGLGIQAVSGFMLSCEEDSQLLRSFDDVHHVLVKKAD